MGSTRGPKVEAVHSSLRVLRQKFPDFLRREPEVIARSVPSGTAPTPRSSFELMSGAEDRARAVYAVVAAEQGEPPDLAVGLEGGLQVVRLRGGARWAFLEAWAFVTNGPRGYFGSGGCIQLPQKLAEAVIDAGEELGAAADRLFGLTDVAGGPGTFGVLTARLITRQEAFVRALLHALAPFYNPSAC